MTTLKYQSELKKEFLGDCFDENKEIFEQLPKKVFI
jgi:hypothetical protein